MSFKAELPFKKNTTKYKIAESTFIKLADFEDKPSLEAAVALLCCSDLIFHFESFSQLGLKNKSEVKNGGKKREFHKLDFYSILLSSPFGSNTRVIFSSVFRQHSFCSCELRAVHHSCACWPCDRSCRQAYLVIEILSAFSCQHVPSLYLLQTARN